VWIPIISVLVTLLVCWVIFDVLQVKHAVLHNFPIIGHFRYWLESIGPELRQYIVTGNDEERPFSRDQRRWVYASSKKENNYFGFGTDLDLEKAPNSLIIKHAAFPLSEPRQDDELYDPLHKIPCAKVLGAHRGRAKAFRPESVINISGMSFGSLSGPAVEALNRGSKIAGCLHNTGEGGLSKYHQHEGSLIWQIGTGYYGCRDKSGKFDLQLFLDVIQANPVHAIELKLSQGAKPGMGGLLPAAKITKEISEIRGIAMGRDCVSPASHSEFSDVDSMLDFVERLADESGLPIGIKSAVGESRFWEDLARQMATTSRGVDFITIDGGEGGTGAGPLVFNDHVALPFCLAMARVYGKFVAAGMHQKIVFVGSGKLGFPERGLLAMALGCDLINVGREAMLAIGCIQAQRCHTGHCPTGVATQNRWLMSGLDPTHKSNRLANYIVALRKELMQLSRACGEPHPALITTEHFEIVDERFLSISASEVFSYQPEWSLPSPDCQQAIRQIMSGEREYPVGQCN